MKSSIENLMTHQLEALLLPPKESPYFWLVLLGFLVLMGSLSWLVKRWWQHRNTSKEIAKRRINALFEGDIPPFEATQYTAIELTSLLRKGLGVTRLDEYKPTDLNSWNNFCSRLDYICYSAKEEQHKTSLKVLFEESLVWLSTHKE